MWLISALAGSRPATADSKKAVRLNVSCSRAGYATASTNSNAWRIPWALRPGNKFDRNLRERFRVLEIDPRVFPQAPAGVAIIRRLR